MNNEAILEQIALNPNCRAVQLADWLDLDLEDVQASLAALQAVGDVSATPGTSPAGSPCQLYDLTAKFQASDKGTHLAAKVGAAKFRQSRPGLSKVALAIEYVRERGVATSSELHALLALKPTEVASSYLAGALSDGRLVKDGKNWTAGAIKPVPVLAKPTPPATDPKPFAVPVFVAPPPPQTPAPQPAPKPVPKSAPEPAPGVELAKPSMTSTYRCALWSDGILEVQKDGETVAELPKAAGESLAAFLGRLTAEQHGIK
ncbi:MAG: hypothetical protein ACXU8N_18255 [Telluria sp.]